MTMPLRVLLAAAPEAPMHALADRLRREGLDVADCPSATEALERATTWLPSAAILDASLPSSQLFRLYGMLRNGAASPEVPILFTNHPEARNGNASRGRSDLYFGPAASTDEVVAALRGHLHLPEPAIDTAPTTTVIASAEEDSVRLDQTPPAPASPEPVAGLDDPSAAGGRDDVPNEPPLAAADIALGKDEARPTTDSDAGIVDEPVVGDGPEGRNSDAGPVHRRRARSGAGHRSRPTHPRSLAARSASDTSSDGAAPQRYVETADGRSILLAVATDSPRGALADQRMPAKGLDDEITIGAILGAVARRWWVAALVLVSVMAADVYYTMTRQPTYLARATLVISPSPNVDRGSLVYSVDSLGRGRIVGTYAEVLGSEIVHRLALERLGYPPSAINRDVILKSSTVADTAVIQVTAESTDPELSAAAANLVGEIGIDRMGELYPVYNLTFLTVATPPTRPYRPDPVRNYSLGFVFGIVLGVVLAYLFDLGWSLFARRDEQLSGSAADWDESSIDGADVEPSSPSRASPLSRVPGWARYVRTGAMSPSVALRDGDMAP